MNRIKNFVILAIMTSSTWVGAQEAQATQAKGDANKVLCKAGGTERTLEMVTNGEGCILNYTKDGQTKDIAHQKKGSDFCLEKLDTIRKKLESSDFKCQ